MSAAKQVKRLDQVLDRGARERARAEQRHQRRLEEWRDTTVRELAATDTAIDLAQEHLETMRVERTALLKALQFGG